MSADPPAVQALGLGRSFGQNHAVDGVDLTIPAGTIFGLLGPDGATSRRSASARCGTSSSLRSISDWSSD
jgi:ABC-type Fe3+/spermidine/putrescine transport system ATPase subunit